MSKYDNDNGINLFAIVITAVVAAFVSSFVTYKATSGNQKFAVVDVQRVVSSSRDVAALKIERDNQIRELKRMADNANEKIKAEEDEVKRQKLSEQYLGEINSRKEGYDKFYASALQASDQRLNEVINTVAQKEGLKVILNKSSVVNGGVDITDSVIELVK